MPNLVKYNNIIVKSEDKIVIDSNKLVENILEQQQRNFAQKADHPDEDGFICGLDAATVEQLVSDEPVITEEQQNRIDSILEDANREAESIIEAARSEAIQIREEAKKSGYNEGLAAGTKDADAILTNKINMADAEIAQRKSELEEEYEELKNKLEPELVNVILEVFENAFGVITEENKTVIMALINSVMKNTEISKEFMIRVSDEDYDYVYSNKELIYGSNASDITIEISKDNKLGHNECIIETDAGVFDCSLDIQLKNLINEIKILSCAR